MNASTTRHGMTLVEVLAVVVILSLIAGTLLVGFGGTFGKAKHELAKSGMAHIAGQVEIYKVNTGTWPTNDLGLGALGNGHSSPADPHYLGPDKLLDPWGNAYIYVTPGPDGHPYEILCYGADAASGGDGENADITSTNLRGL